MNFFKFFFLILVLQSISVQSQPPKNIFILAGQSNMAGRGGVVNKNGTSTWDGVVPPECKPNPSILRLSADLQWVQAHEPLHADIDLKKTNGIGPGLAFANSVLTRNPSFGSIGLVPCAIGGTALDKWAKGGELYGQLVKRAKAAVQTGGAIRAVLWYQGESDTVRIEDAASYQGKLRKFFLGLAGDLNFPAIPFIQVALASGEGSYVEIVRAAQFGIDLPNVRTVDGKGLPLQSDGLHVTTAGQIQLAGKLTYKFIRNSL